MALTERLPRGTDDSVNPAGSAHVSADDMNNQARAAAGFLKALAHEGRLMILCHLSAGERTVGELEDLLDLRQATVSQQLARLRLEGLVSCRREGKAMHYTIADPRAREIVATVYDLFCGSARR